MSPATILQKRHSEDAILLGVIFIMVENTSDVVLLSRGCRLMRRRRGLRWMGGRLSRNRPADAVWGRRASSRQVSGTLAGWWFAGRLRCRESPPVRTRRQHARWIG